MTKRAYISCPLQAALAAKNFGFKFLYGVGMGEPDQVATPKDFASHYLNNCGVYYYIAPESLPLLEPVVGDIAEIPNSINTVIIIHSAEECNDFRIDGVIPDYAYETPEDAVKYGYTKIIQRQGKVFPTIQFEDVE